MTAAIGWMVLLMLIGGIAVVVSSIVSDLRLNRGPAPHPLPRPRKDNASDRQHI